MKTSSSSRQSFTNYYRTTSFFPWSHPSNFNYYHNPCRTNINFNIITTSKVFYYM